MFALLFNAPPPPHPTKQSCSKRPTNSFAHLDTEPSTFPGVNFTPQTSEAAVHALSPELHLKYIFIHPPPKRKAQIQPSREFARQSISGRPGRNIELTKSTLNRSPKKFPGQDDDDYDD